MFPWLNVWAPHLYFPWSGSVRQNIEPNTNWFFDSIDASAGNGPIEKKAFEVASYGRQLGLLSELLIELADQNATLSPEAVKSLQRLKDIAAQIQGIKDDHAAAVASDIETQMNWLLNNSPFEFQRLAGKFKTPA